MGFGLTFSPNKPLENNARLATDQTVASLSRPIMPLSIGVSIARAIETLRLTNLDFYPIVSGSRLVTMLSANDLSGALQFTSDFEADRLRLLSLSTVLDQIISGRPSQPVLLKSDSLNSAITLFNAYPEISVIGVVDEMRSFYGVLGRIDLLAYTFKTLAPSRVGGMATPLGVYLTDGVDSGGVGNFGLFLAGATLTSLFTIAMVASNASDIVALNHHIDVNGIIERLIMPVLPGYAVTIVTNLRSAVTLFLMLMLLRLIPVAGYHAAEHQVVHCIERGEPLMPKNVAAMPRPHPRCGTNLVSAVMLFGVYLTVLTGVLQSGSSAIVPAALATVLTWRQVGTFLQQYFTTRPASQKQLASGIRAGQDLLTKYRQDVNRKAKFPMRVWRMGFVQMIAGSSVPALVLWALDRYVPVVQPYLQGIY
jgi:CBS domain-containing protein